jgi:hypothetical protein
LRLFSIAVISLPTPVAPSRWISPAIPHMVLVSFASRRRYGKQSR